MTNMYTVTLARPYMDPRTYNVAASNSDRAIERARIQAWKERKYYKKSSWDVVGLVKSDTQIVV